MRIKFAKKFVKDYERAGFKIQKAVKERIDLFNRDPFYSKLRNYQLSGKYSGYRSINITGDWRAIFLVLEQTSSETVISFEMLGTHSQLYK